MALVSFMNFVNMVRLLSRFLKTTSIFVNLYKHSFQWCFRAWEYQIQTQGVPLIPSSVVNDANSVAVGGGEDIA